MDIEENLQRWQNKYNWNRQGDEWSRMFGGTEALWWFALYPRLHRYLPTGTILEIAPGYGRWTEYLRHLCRSLIVVDIAEKCIEACKKRFATASNISYHVNDGRSLDMVPDGTVDLVFSFDSLVHCEQDVIESYLYEIAKKLKPDGVGFLHHSNLDQYRNLVRIHNCLPPRFHLRGLFCHLVSINMTAWRAPSMSATKFAKFCHAANLKCISQELISWYFGTCAIDAISVFARPEAVGDQACRQVSNSGFVRQADDIKKLSQLYAC